MHQTIITNQLGALAVRSGTPGRGRLRFNSWPEILCLLMLKPPNRLTYPIMGLVHDFGKEVLMLSLRLPITGLNSRLDSEFSGNANKNHPTVIMDRTP